MGKLQIKGGGGEVPVLQPREQFIGVDALYIGAVDGSGNIKIPFTAGGLKTLLETLTGDARLDATAIKNLPESGTGGGSSDTVPFLKTLSFTDRAPFKIFHNKGYYYVAGIGWIRKYDEHLNEIVEFKCDSVEGVQKIKFLSDGNLIVGQANNTNIESYTNSLLKISHVDGSVDSEFSTNCPVFEYAITELEINNDLVYFHHNHVLQSLNADGTVNSGFANIAKIGDTFQKFRIINDKIHTYETLDEQEGTGMRAHLNFIINRYNLDGTADSSFATINTPINDNDQLLDMNLFGLANLVVLNNGDCFHIELNMMMNFKIVKTSIATGTRTEVFTQQLTMDDNMPMYFIGGSNNLYVMKMASNPPDTAELDDIIDVDRYDSDGNFEMDVMDNVLDHIDFVMSISGNPPANYYTEMLGLMTGPCEVNGNLAFINTNANAFTGVIGSMGNVQLFTKDGGLIQQKPFYENGLTVARKIKSILGCSTGDMIIVSDDGLAKLEAPTVASTLKHSGVAGELPSWVADV